MKTGRIVSGEKLLAVLPNAPKSITVDEFKKCEGCKLSEAADGTTLTIYKNEEWCIATNGGANAYDVYMFGHSVGEVFIDILTNMVEDWKNMLSPESSYSFCFSSYLIHRFQEDGFERIWFIQSVNTVNAQKTGTIEINTTSPFPQIEPQRVLDFASVNLENLQNAFENYKKTGIRIYGIVATSHSIEAGNTVFVIESDLYKLIRNMLYSNGLNVKFGKCEKEHTIISITNAYLQDNPLVHHFPNYSHMIEAMGLILSRLVDMIYAIVKVPYLRRRQSTEFGKLLESTARDCHIALSELHRLSIYEDTELLRIINSYCYSNLILKPLSALLFKSL
jgi:hypothetical protein